MDSNRRAMDTGDWRNQLQADSRQRIVSKLMDALTRLLPSSGQEGLQELERIASRFEEKTYTAATSWSDYLRKISMKIMTMETKLQNPLQPNGANTGHNSSHQAHGMQTEVQNPQPVPPQHLPQQSNPIQREQKQLYQPQRLAEASSNSLNSTVQTNGGDWQEEVYQKIKSIKDMYFVDLNDVLMKISSKLQQHDSQPQQPRSEPLEKFRNYKVVLESLVGFLRTNRSEMQGYHRDKWPAVEKQIIHILNSNWSRRTGPLQGQLPQPQMSLVQIEDNQMNPQMQPMNLRSSISMQPYSFTNLQQMVVKPPVFQQHHPNGHRAAYQHQIKSGSPFPFPPPQVLQPHSPKVPPHHSPQIDQQNVLTTMTKAGTPLQPASSPFVALSPSTPSAPSPMPGESEKLNSSLSLLSNNGNTGHSQVPTVGTAAQSLAIGTPGISASPLLAEFSSLDGAHVNASTAVSSKLNVVEQPPEWLTRAVKSIIHTTLAAPLRDISSVESMVDRTAPGNESRAAVGEDLVAMTKCRLRARNSFTQDEPSGTKRMRHSTSAIPSHDVSSVRSLHDGVKQLNGCDAFELESTTTSSIQRSRIEPNHALIEEIGEINRRLVETVVEICKAEGGEGIIVKCSFSAVALSPNLKAQYASAQLSPIQPLRLLIPTNYPNSSPILLDEFPVAASKEYEYLSTKVKSKFGNSLTTLSQPMSLSVMARTWDVCARAAVSEFAQQSGGGTFSSKYGTWESCLTTA